MLNKMIGTNSNLDFADVNRIHPQKEKRVYWGLADPIHWGEPWFIHWDEISRGNQVVLTKKIRGLLLNTYILSKYVYPLK